MARTHSAKAVLLLLLVGYLVGSAFFTTSFEQGLNNRNVSVDTRVNITQSLPIILSVVIDGGATNITLNAGSTRWVECNASALDYNGGNTLRANATLYWSTTDLPLSPDDNNTHYTNASCTNGSTNSYYRNFTCGFAVQYYANPGYWNCTVNVTDDYNFTAQDRNRTHIDGLLALNVTTLIDYGNLAVGDVSPVREANVTNLGNLNISVAVKGYGSTMGDGLAFNCTVGNISVEWEKYNYTNNGQDPTQYFNLSASYATIPVLRVLQQVADNNRSLNSTYWLLHVPPNPYGTCNGTVVFQAEA